MASLSKSGKCFAIRDNIAGPGTQFTEVATGACTGANARAGGFTWADTW
jgi:hypothetical protein